MEYTEIEVSCILNKKILIIGDVGRGKTRLTAKILDALVSNGLSKHITVIDMAPTAKNVGARISAYTENVKNVRYFFSEKIRGPRIEGKNASEVLEIARANKEIVEKFLEEYLDNPTEILIVNDLTLYLHAGDISKILDLMERSKTFVANAYYGNILSDDKNSGLTSKEKLLVQMLSKKFDTVIIL
ncbi:MAG: hypothetical protein N3F64_06670 [Nitrososphaeria archaeon]|nr:hypothetical protein [Nitrososphaeria archaeon]